MRSLALFAVLLAACENVGRASARPSAERAAASSAAFDVIIANGEVIDGTGAKRKRADVGIRGDTIVAIGDLSKSTAKTTLDAKGQVVTPGFIDLLGNSQAAVLLDPRLEGKIRQGVTTEVTGEGHSPGPQNEPMLAEMERTKPKGWPKVTWHTLGEFMDVVEKNRTALNFAFYVGAANSREMVLGHADRAPTAAELRQMEAITRQAIDEGAVGVSSALIYPPGRFATTDELIALARVGGSYWTHLRSESANIDAAIDEAIRIGREAKVPVNIFHLKIGGAANAGRMRAIIDKINTARSSGVDVAANVYPFTASSTDLTSIVGAWALEGGYPAFRERLKNPELRARIANELRSARLRPGAAPIVIRGNPSRRLDEIAASMKVDLAEAALRVFEGADKSPLAIFPSSTGEADMKLALVQPWVAFGSDSGAVVEAMKEYGGHPRAYATFTRVLAKHVREEKLLTLEEAVRKMTSLAASRAGLADRGVLRERMKADVIVFDPAKVQDRSTYEDPHHFSEGVAHVIVNGMPVLRDGAMTGQLPGRVLRRQGSGKSPRAATGSSAASR
ncbi:MAG TPA: D-aminoacylase [Thermoanaerobaculia bacterium]|nr:D-aminoacylase [Thermoanaerobaculia bacterium]